VKVKTNSFSKEETLSSKIEIEALFKEGNSFFKYPFKVLHKDELSKDKFVVKLLITVPKRNFKLAVDRNRIKRLIREAYRLNKQIIYDKIKDDSKNLNLAFIYTPRTILSFQEIERKIILILHTIKKKDEVSVD